MAKSQFDIDNNSNAQPEVATTAANTATIQPDNNTNNFVAGANDNVVINDNSPVVILFGAGSSGKTMTLIRLSKFLIDNGYRIEPVRTFRDARDTHYKEMCDKFPELINSSKAPGRTHNVDFMLVKVTDKWGHPICQLLEAPGEHYFNPQKPNEINFPTYLQTIKEHRSRKTWMFIIEKDWAPQIPNYTDDSIRRLYASKIKKLQDNYVLLAEGDKVIFTLHKADKHLIGGQLNVPQLFKDVKGQYPSIFDNYQNTIPVIKWFKPYIFDFVPFSAGSFTDDGIGGEHYILGKKDKYPALLWKSILKTVKGGF
jgi:hypothetical protein